MMAIPVAARDVDTSGAAETGNVVSGGLGKALDP